MSSVDLVRISFDQQQLQLFYGNGCSGLFQWQEFDQILAIRLDGQPHWLLQANKNFALIDMALDSERSLEQFFKQWPNFNRDGLIKWLDQTDSSECCCYSC